MATDDDDWICSACVEDRYLVAEIKKDGIRRKCTYCSRLRKCFTLSAVADRVHLIFLERYHAADVYDHGDSALVCVAQILEIDENAVAEAFHEYLSDKYGGWPGDGDDNPYDDGHSYLLTRSTGRSYARKWKELARSLRHESRYFNRAAHTILDEIFDGLDFGISDSAPLFKPLFSRESVVTTIQPRSKRAVLYRAREARDEATVRKYLHEPSSELSAPPPRIARAGRMNPTGISLFYGSFDPDTCIAEIRPPVGTYAVIARFQVLRPLRLLDFGKLPKAYESLSHFHPQYVAKRDRDAFLQAFASAISIPVHPQDENLGYLPTQAVAEYLAQRNDLKLDGLIFPSTQTGKAGTNVVLFQHAAHVEALTHSYKAEWGRPLEDMPEVTVIATPISKPEPSETELETNDIPSIVELLEEMPFGEPLEPSPPPPPPTLRLDANGFRVEVIGTVRYNHASLNVEYTTASDKSAKEDKFNDIPF